MCERCEENFNLTSRCPYILPCGHTLCYKCLYNLFIEEKKRIKCPFDFTYFKMDFNDIPKNVVLYEIINKRFEQNKKEEIKLIETKSLNFEYHKIHSIIYRFFYRIYIIFHLHFIFTLFDIIIYPFKKIYEYFIRIRNYISETYQKIKIFIKDVIDYIKSIEYKKHFDSFIKKFEIINEIRIKIINYLKKKFPKPLFIYYPKIMKKIIFFDCPESDFQRYIKLFSNIFLLLLIHLFVIFFLNFEYYFITLILINESVQIIGRFLKLKEKNEYKYKKLTQSYSSGEDEEEKKKNLEERTEKLFLRGKKCIFKWLQYLIYYFFYNQIEKYYFFKTKNNQNYLQHIIYYIFSIGKIAISIYITK
jgi:hypothetical protein